MDANTKLSEKVAVLAAIGPSAQVAGALTSGWVSARDFHRIAALIKTGVLGASATVDAKIQQATDGAGTGAKDITGKAITQIVKATGDNKQAIIEVDANDLDANNGFYYVQLSVTVGVATSQTDATLFGLNGRYLPASAYNPASVVQVAG